MIRPVMLSFWSFFTLFVLCRFGEMMTGYFDKISDTIYISDWYRFPTKSQKMLLIIIHTAQQPIIISGYGNTMLTHDSFKEVSSRFRYFLKIHVDIWKVKIAISSRSAYNMRCRIWDGANGVFASGSKFKFSSKLMGIPNVKLAQAAYSPRS